MGSLPSNMSLDESSVRDMAESETDCSEGLDEVVLGRIASLPLDPFPPRDFRGKFKKMRHKKRPTILESRYRFVKLKLSRILFLIWKKSDFLFFFLETHAANSVTAFQLLLASLCEMSHLPNGFVSYIRI